MNFYEVFNHFDKTRYFAAAATEALLLEMVNAVFLEELKDISDDEGLYDDLRESRELRMEEITYELLLEDVTEETMQMKDLPSDLRNYYF